MTYEEAKIRLSRRQSWWGWTQEDVEAQELVCAVEGIPEPETLRHLRATYAKAVTDAGGTPERPWRVPDQSAILDEVVRTVTVDGAKIVEERIRILLRPKPRWMPERLWRLLVKRFLVIETTRPAP